MLSVTMFRLFFIHNEEVYVMNYNVVLMYMDSEKICVINYYVELICIHNE